jgi:hypothetical protein
MIFKKDTSYLTLEMRYYESILNFKQYFRYPFSILMEDVGLLNIFDWKIVLFLFGPISMMIEYTEGASCLS